MAAFAREEEITIQCQTIAQSLSNLSNENNDTISKESLEQFFSQCALTFGQESNGKTEAIDLIAVLKAKQIDTSTFDNDNVSREDFMVWLKERFVEHPHHLSLAEKVSTRWHATKSHCQRWLEQHLHRRLLYR